MAWGTDAGFYRLVPQVVYYVSAYAELVKSEEIELGEKINIVVPTGNFGNILAGWYSNLQNKLNKIYRYKKNYTKDIIHKVTTKFVKE